MEHCLGIWLLYHQPAALGSSIHKNAYLFWTNFAILFNIFHCKYTCGHLYFWKVSQLENTFFFGLVKVLVTVTVFLNQNHKNYHHTEIRNKFVITPKNWFRTALRIFFSVDKNVYCIL